MRSVAEPVHQRRQLGGTQNITLPEILADFGVPDWLFVGTGTAGTFTGCFRGIQELRLPTRLVAVDTCGSVTFGGPPVAA
ncbi:hypothetical protein Asn12ST33_05080 [Cutibacterium acnes]|nr:hypothetical protein Asn12ST33_05080 [Cutibacterium acnes]